MRFWLAATTGDHENIARLSGRFALIGKLLCRHYPAILDSLPVLDFI